MHILSYIPVTWLVNTPVTWLVNIPVTWLVNMYICCWLIIISQHMYTYMYVCCWLIIITTYVYTHISSYIPVTSLVNMYMHTCDATRQCVCHDSPAGVLECDMITRQMYTWFTYSYAWCDSSTFTYIHVTRLVNMCAMTRLRVSIHVTWLVNMYQYMWHD